MHKGIGARTAQALALLTLSACSAVTPIQEKTVHFSNGNVSLADSLFLPAAGRPHPAVVLFHRSGRKAVIGRWRSGSPNRVWPR
jgi:hypothetical protein